MDAQKILQRIEIVREELAYEYEKCMESRVVNPKVLEISEELDKLIVEYTKRVNSDKRLIDTK